MSRLLRKVLIANRGEIACRIMRTAKIMGISTVAIYSDIDKHSKFVSMADQAYRVGPNPSLESYLNSSKIIEIAKDSGCEALHPGFGFLSENASFAEECNTSGVKFIGPPGSAIIQMGSKSASKIIMTNANVPVVPGYHGKNQDPKYLQEEARKIGFPVLIKAVSGGGGRGMRIVHNEADFSEALDSCKRQSLKAFKDDNVLVEKYIVKPRHIEVQIFGDQFKSYVHFYERDCSIQRRHQKVVEQAPSNLSDSLREQIYKSAIDAARAVGYYNAGTVEFIFDLNSNKHYFMEMNTRLQVEHPISEMITNQDLVRWQFLVASGFPLPKKQEEIKKKGHAIEVRVYSENPYNGFLPGSGTLKYFRDPKQIDQKVRIETGVREGDTISTFYDPMIAKLITYADTRDNAISEMRKALREYRVVGLPTNLKFLKNVFDDPVFQQGDYDTSYIAKNSDNLIKRVNKVAPFDLSSAVAAKLALDFSKVKLPKELISFRNGRYVSSNVKITATATFFEAPITSNLQVQIISSQKATILLEGKKHEVTFKQTTPNTLLITYDGRTVSREFYIQGETVYIFDEHGDTLEFSFESNKLTIVKKEEKNEKSPKSPMSGTMVKVFVKVGDKVTKGQPLFIIEAMKMEHTIRASLDSVVKKVASKEGAFVEAGAIIVELQ